MSQTIFWYDLETSGINPREQRIMQFAGQRTDLDLNPVGEPVNVLIALTPEIIPEPDAILITGITPQQTIAEGLTEVEFLRLFTDEVATPGTIMAGYNTVRFDDEFMRYLHYRNFYDAYEWQWKDDRSKWDLLDVVRMTRALRPEGIKWPVDDTGKATNRLELLTKLNGIDHESAHDALNDVRASIEVAKLIRTKQPKLYDYLFAMRTKQKVSELVLGGKPFIYTSGKYDAAFEKTNVVATLTATDQGALVYDLRFDPRPFANMSTDELVAVWTKRSNEEGLKLPVKTIKFNRCPAVAPLTVLDDASKERLKLDMTIIKENLSALQDMKLFVGNLEKALEVMDDQQQKRFAADKQSVDERLYDGFFGFGDKDAMSVVRAANAQELSTMNLKFKDERLQEMMPLYKARNYPKSLSDEDRAQWEVFRTEQLMGGGTNSRVAKFVARLSELSAQTGLTKSQAFLLEELKLYAESILPSEG